MLGTQATYNDYEAVACQGGSLSTDTAPSNEVTTGFSANIGDRVWSDTDGDGVQDAGEPGLGGIEVCATPTGGGAAVCTTTDSLGNYRIYGLTNGAPYNVTYTPATVPGGYVPTTPATLTRTATLAGVNDADFGLRRPAPPPSATPCGSMRTRTAWSIRARTACRASLSSCTSTSTTTASVDAGDYLLDTKITDGNGNYLFTGLQPDDYLVVVDETSQVTSPYGGGTSTLAAAMDLVVRHQPARRHHHHAGPGLRHRRLWLQLGRLHRRLRLVGQ